MQNTGGVTDKTVIYICCLVFYITLFNNSINIVVILVPVIFSALLSYFESEKLHIALTFSFSLMACFVPELVVFLPVVAYDMIFCRYQAANITGIIPLFLYIKSAKWQTSLIAVSILMVSLFLKIRSNKHLELKVKYNSLADEAREISMRLKKQNKELIEKQDFELANATLNERNRIAREIHDSVGHLLSSAILQSGALLTINRDEKVEASLKTLKDTLDQAMNSIRASVHQLYDESLDLKAKIMEIAERFTFCELSFDYQINENPDKKIKYLFLSIIKEALSNVIRHSDATRVTLMLREHPALYQLIIRDNGTVRSSHIDGGIGLKNMADGVEAMKGNINILTDNGFEIFISIPK